MSVTIQLESGQLALICVHLPETRSRIVSKTGRLRRDLEHIPPGLGWVGLVRVGTAQRFSRSIHLSGNFNRLARGVRRRASGRTSVGPEALQSRQLSGEGPLFTAGTCDVIEKRLGKDPFKGTDPHHVKKHFKSRIGEGWQQYGGEKRDVQWA